MKSGAQHYSSSWDQASPRVPRVLSVACEVPFDLAAGTLCPTPGAGPVAIHLRMSAKHATLPPLSRKDLERLRDRAADAAALMRALSNESRLLILCTLAGREMSVSELNEQIPLSQSALSQQLAVLRREGLVETRREAQTIYYSLAPTDALRVISLLREIYCPGRTRKRPGSRSRARAGSRPR